MHLVSVRQFLLNYVFILYLMFNCVRDNSVKAVLFLFFAYLHCSIYKRWVGLGWVGLRAVDQRPSLRYVENKLCFELYCHHSIGHLILKPKWIHPNSSSENLSHQNPTCNVPPVLCTFLYPSLCFHRNQNPNTETF